MQTAIHLCGEGRSIIISQAYSSMIDSLYQKYNAWIDEMSMA